MKKTILSVLLGALVNFVNPAWAGAGAVDPAAAVRLQAWAQISGEVISKPEADKVEAVNRFFNENTQYKPDAELYGQDEYWASPVETVMSGAGDCEDYAIAKFFTLRNLGVPAGKLRLAYSLVEDGQRHMVLIYTPEQGEGFVLDNLTNQLIALDARDGLKVVYSFDDEWLYLGVSEKSVRKANNLARWTGVQKQLMAFTF